MQIKESSQENIKVLIRAIADITWRQIIDISDSAKDSGKFYTIDSDIFLRCFPIQKINYTSKNFHITNGLRNCSRD